MYVRLRRDDERYRRPYAYRGWRRYRRLGDMDDILSTVKSIEGAVSTGVKTYKDATKSSGSSSSSSPQSAPQQQQQMQQQNPSGGATGGNAPGGNFLDTLDNKDLLIGSAAALALLLAIAR